MSKFTKEFWVDEDTLEVINKDLYDNIILSRKVSTSKLNKITISYEIDREVTIKESDFEKHLQEWGLKITSISVTDYLKQKLFGGGENE